MKRINLLFQKEDDTGDTPFQEACKRFKQNDATEEVQNTLSLYSPTTPMNSLNVLMLAAINERILFDNVYFVLIRQSDVLIRML